MIWVSKSEQIVIKQKNLVLDTREEEFILNQVWAETGILSITKQDNGEQQSNWNWKNFIWEEGPPGESHQARLSRWQQSRQSGEKCRTDGTATFTKSFPFGNSANHDWGKQSSFDCNESETDLEQRKPWHVSQPPDTERDNKERHFQIPSERRFRKTNSILPCLTSGPSQKHR